MSIKELIAAMQAGVGDNEVVGENLGGPSFSAMVTPIAVSAVQEASVVPEPENTTVTVETPSLVETPVKEDIQAPETVVPAVGKPKRGRKMVYDLSDMAVGDYIVYDGKLSSGRVLASLKGKEGGKRFQAKEVEFNMAVGKEYVKASEVRITRKA